MVAVAISAILLVPLASAGAGSDATLSTTTVNFADRSVGTTSDAQAVTLTNSGAAPLAISTFRITGSDAADFAQGADCPISPDTLPAGGSCTIYVSFTPDGAGPKSASLVIGDDAASSPQTVALGGTGVSAPQLQLAPAALGFGSQTVGTTSAQRSVSITNSGGAALALSAVGLSGAQPADFALANACPAPPATLAPGDSCLVTVSFSPAAEGARSAALTVSDNAPGSPHSVALSGAGVAAGTYLSDGFESGSLGQWDALSTSDSTIALDSSVANSGTSSVRVTNTSAQQSSRLMADLAGGGHAQSYTRFCFRIAPGLSQGIELANGRAITAAYPLGIRRWEITYNPVTKGLEGYFFNDALQRLDLYAANGQVLAGQWYCAELYLDESTSGQAQLWLNGVSVGAVAGDLGTPDPYSRLYLWNQPSAGTVWFDDVKVASTPSGPVGAGAGSLPGPAVTLSPTILDFGSLGTRTAHHVGLRDREHMRNRRSRPHVGRPGRRRSRGSLQGA